MSLFIDKHNRRKSPLALAAFGAALAYLCIFGVLYAVLAKPLYDHVRLGSSAATVTAHSIVIALAGAAICCLFFLLRDKRVAPLGFAGLAVILCMFYAAALMLEAAERSLMLQLITMYGLAPVLVGNAVAWPVYRKLRQGNPAPKRRKTIQQELLEAVAEESAKQKRKNPRQEEAAQAAKEEAEAVPSPEEALFGPEAGGSSGVFRSAEEEAMRLYIDDDDEESDD